MTYAKQQNTGLCVTMADVRDCDEVVIEFLLNTCRVSHWLSSYEVFLAPFECAELTTQRSLPDDGHELIPVTTGSVAEFYIQPMLSCVGDVDVMYHYSTQLAIPEGTCPPTQLPDEFHSRVDVYEIVDSSFPGFVYLFRSFILTECIDDGKYDAVQCQRQYLTYEVDDTMHGPASVTNWSCEVEPFFTRVSKERFSLDRVYCMRCLSWPPQAADWPTRDRDYSWPDSATITHVISNGCDVVRKMHRLCSVPEMYRLSFSRAEIVLINSWNRVEQIVYHMLRVFVKTKRMTESAENSDAATLSNYHIKTLMLWACEVKPRSWWNDELNIVSLCFELLQILGDWMSDDDACCPHYFIHCNLFDHPYSYYSEISSRLMSETEASLAEWFICCYIPKCAELCPDSDARHFVDVRTGVKLQKAVSTLADCRQKILLLWVPNAFARAQYNITSMVSCRSLTVRSCLWWIRNFSNTRQRLSAYFTANCFLHVAYKTSDAPRDELLDVLATTCLRSNDARRCLNARHSSVLSLSQAAKLMKVVASSSRSTVQLIEIELSKAYLYRALRCKDSDSDSIYCLINVYLAVLYYATGHYQRAIDHCTLVTRSQDHSQCSSHVVQGELLPKINDDIDTVLGLSVFYQYVRTAALSQQQQTQHVSVFTTELFAHYLHFRCLSVIKCRQLTQTSSTDEVQRYRKCFYELQEVFISDVMVLTLVNLNYTTNDETQIVVIGHPVPEISLQLNTAELVQLLQQSAVEHLTIFRQRNIQVPEFGSLCEIVTTDFEALYAYKCGEYQRCLQLSAHNVRMLIDVDGISCVIVYPEFIQLMDDDIASLVGLMLIVNPSCRSGKGQYVNSSIRQLYLSLYLMAQCQMKLHYPVTSLTHTLDYVKVACRLLDERVSLDQLLLKLTERKILLYM